MQNGEGKFCIFVEVWKNEETMMEFKDRRSIRKYSRRRLPDGQIEALAGEASRAATMGNMQLYSLVVTEDGPEREALAAAHSLTNPNTNCGYLLNLTATTSPSTYTSAT